MCFAHESPFTLFSFFDHAFIERNWQVLHWGVSNSSSLVSEVRIWLHFHTTAGLSSVATESENPGIIRCSPYLSLMKLLAGVLDLARGMAKLKCSWQSCESDKHFNKVTPKACFRRTYINIRNQITSQWHTLYGHTLHDYNCIGNSLYAIA